MFKISLATWIAHAAARLTGTYGDVTQQAEAADCSRQTVSDQARKVQAAVEAEHSGGPCRSSCRGASGPRCVASSRLRRR